jgi:hypothetical protein
MRIQLSILFLAGLWCWAINAINNDKGLNPEDLRERDRVRAASNRSILLLLNMVKWFGLVFWIHRCVFA